MAENAGTAWAEERKAYPREAYVAGYERGSFDERLRLVAFIGEHQETLQSFAGEKGMELLAYMLSNLTPEPSDSDSAGS